MQGRVQKWGNSLAVRIPSAFAQELRLEEGTEVEVRLDGDTLRIGRFVRRPSLAQLLAGVPAGMTFREWQTGPAQEAEQLA